MSFYLLPAAALVYGGLVIIFAFKWKRMNRMYALQNRDRDLRGYSENYMRQKE